MCKDEGACVYVCVRMRVRMGGVKVQTGSGC